MQGALRLVLLLTAVWLLPAQVHSRQNGMGIGRRNLAAIDLPWKATPSAISKRLRHYRSERLGITHCRMQGVINEEDVSLHVWLRMVPPSARKGHTGNNATVKGFAYLMSGRGYQSTFSQVVQSRAMIYFSDNIYIRSHYTRINYNLTVITPGHPDPVYPPPPQSASFQPPMSQPQQQFGGRRVRQQPFSAINATASQVPHSPPGFNQSAPPEVPLHLKWSSTHVISIHGEFALHPNDTSNFDFELRAGGFKWHCPIVLERPTLPVHSPEKGWKHQDHASLTEATQPVFLISPMVQQDMGKFARVLWHNMAWHQTLGVKSYMMYVTHQVTALLREPLIQALIASGRLQVVLFNDMPVHDHGLGYRTRFDHYCMQAIIYNHMLLAIWGADSLGIAADVDEFFLTAEPKSLVEVFKTCQLKPPPRNATQRAGMQVVRVYAMCAPNSGLCRENEPQLSIFSDLSPPEEVARGRLPHPLVHLTMARNLSVIPFTSHQGHETKAIMDPSFTMEQHIHFGYALPGAHVTWGKSSCVRLLHIWSLFKHRSKVLIPPDPKAVQHWFWPVQALAKAGQGP